MHNSKLTGNGAPTGIAITVLAYNYFNVSKEYDYFSSKYVYDDFSALYAFVETIKSSFVLAYSSEMEDFYHKISINLPVEPQNNLFDKMTENQMETLYQEVSTMLDKLNKVKEKGKKSEACEILVELFGADFPVTVDKSLVGTSESA